MRMIAIKDAFFWKIATANATAMSVGTQRRICSRVVRGCAVRSTSAAVRGRRV